LRQRDLGSQFGTWWLFGAAIDATRCLNARYADQDNARVPIGLHTVMPAGSSLIPMAGSQRDSVGRP